MKVQRLQVVTRNDTKKAQRDRRQNNRLFNRKFRGGLPKRLIAEHQRIIGGTKCV